MLKHLRPAFSLVILMTIITGVAYPYAMTGVAKVAAPAKADGSLLAKDGQIVGSALIGQNFASDRYFWPRPSATSPNPYDPTASGGSNLGPTAAKLKDRVAGDVDKLKKTGISTPIPADAVTASGSGLDPDITPAYALAQIDRVAKARGIETGKVSDLVNAQIENRLFGFIGEPHVNVLSLNMALDALKS
ncbi:K+-transporting ATPase ATPase C chain [Rhizobium aquaticum]|uniref:Potassium-transporting ATPase KdpC subunit n=1 Tax=Rhizobium aquaticum TaxID=1549636 RepID=A0ABV2J2V0_9HYPH